MLLGLASAVTICWLQVLTINPAGNLVLALKKLHGIDFIKVTEPEVSLPPLHLTWVRHHHHSLSTARRC